MDTGRIEQMRLEDMNLRAIAQAEGVSYDYLKKVCSKCALNSAKKIRREVVARFQGKGTPKEIAEFLLLYHKQNVSAKCVSDIIRQMNRQRMAA